jgi:hypothetical protein
MRCRMNTLNAPFDLLRRIEQGARPPSATIAHCRDTPSATSSWHAPTLPRWRKREGPALEACAAAIADWRRNSDMVNRGPKIADYEPEPERKTSVPWWVRQGWQEYYLEAEIRETTTNPAKRNPRALTPLTICSQR